MRVPILTYQPMRIDGNDYRQNDLRALAADLRQVTEAGFRIMPLRSVVDAWLDDRVGELDGKVAAIACDNGADFDYRDLPHPSAGVQRSVINILRDFAAEHPRAQPALNVTSFVIASPEARTLLDATCMIGKGWWTDDWWPAAVASGLVHIANHSWDHNHETLPESFSQGVARGTFLTIDNEKLAEHEIGRAADYLRRHAPNPGAALFAYPYGQPTEYLKREYFPRNGARLGMRAAFTTNPGFFEAECRKWEIPRFLFGRDWSSPEELRLLLESAADKRRAWIAMRPPKAAPSPPARKRPSKLQASLSQPASRVHSGLIASRFEMGVPPALEAAAYELELAADAIGFRRRVPIRLADGSADLPLVIHSHLLPNGKTRFNARLLQDGAEAWSDSFTVEASNVGPLAETVRKSQRAKGTPVIAEGLVDSSAFDIANPALTPWFDRPDALDYLAGLRRAGTIDEKTEAALKQFVEEGYAILPDALDDNLLEKIGRELNDAIAKKVEGYEYGTSQRIQNLHARYPGVKALWQHPEVMRHLELIFGVPARACQTLTYVFGSQQGAHQDTIHLTPFPAGYMCGVWVALEDVRPGSGELEIYAKSHRLPRVYIDGSGCEKVVTGDWSQFDHTVAARWREMLAARDFEKIVYRPKRGTILIWHENLMHAGGQRLDLSLSRRSIVSHYFADGAIAFYDSTGSVGYME